MDQADYPAWSCSGSESPLKHHDVKTFCVGEVIVAQQAGMRTSGFQSGPHSYFYAENVANEVGDGPVRNLGKETELKYEDHAEAMDKHPAPGTTISKYVIPAQGYVAFNLPEGQVLRCVDVEGKQVPDIVCFNSNDLSDEINLANSQLMNKQQELRKGATIVSVRCNPLMTIVGYSNEYCYTYGSMCSEELNRNRYGVANTINCRDNFAAALEPWNFDRTQIPNAFVPFMRVELEEDGTLEIREPTTVPGDYYDLRAEMDLVVAISNCPQELNPVNGFNPTPTGVIIYQPE